MIPPNIVTKFSGPPGTGKSTTLLNVVENLLSSGVDPEHIVYTTFTRAGAYEARDRAAARFNLSFDRLPYFRTLHSLCFGLLPKTDVMQDADWGVIANTLGLFFSARMTIDNPVPTGKTRGDKLRFVWGIARTTQRSFKEVLGSMTPSFLGGMFLSEAEVVHFHETVSSYKKEFGKVDFTDMLEKWLSEGLSLSADYVIIDEAQDLSSLQWAVVGKLCLGAKGVWIAGDDDQCIHEWNGASPNHFIDQEAKSYTVLPQSYRIPATIHNLAESIISRVKKRLPKTYHPREEQGNIERISSLEQIDITSGSWMLLARNTNYLKNYIEFCRQKGLLYGLMNMKSGFEKFLAGIHTWKNLQKGESATAAELKNLYVFMSQRDRIKRGSKMVLGSVDDAKVLRFEELETSYGMVCPRDFHWTKALDMIPEKDAAFLKTVDQKEGLQTSPRVLISTIHGVKGMEAESVVLTPDMSPQTYQSYLDTPDAEHRVWYVAITRAKKSLYLLPASEKAYSL